MTLQDILLLADYEKFAEIYIQRYHQDYDKPWDPYIIAESYRDFARELAGLKPAPNNDIMVGIRTVEDGIPVVEACYYELDSFASPLPAYSLPDTFDTETCSYEDACAICRDIHKILPTNYGIEFSPWEEIIGCKVLKQNLDEVGLEQFLASALFELSFNGMTREDQEERRNELQESVRQYEEIRKLPEEEQEKHFVSAEDLFAELGIFDERTEEEIQEEVRRDMIESVVFAMEKYKELQKIYDILAEEKAGV